MTQDIERWDMTREISIPIPLAGYDLPCFVILSFLIISIPIPLAGYDIVCIVLLGISVISIPIPLAGYDHFQRLL